MVHVVDSLYEQNIGHTPRYFAALVKQKIIDEKQIPVKYRMFNILLKVSSFGAKSPIYWNSIGRKEIMLLEELRSMSDVHIQRQGKGWTSDNTRQELVRKLKTNLEAQFRDPYSNGPSQVM